MINFFAPDQLLHAPARELHNRGWTACAEVPDRARGVLAAIGGAEEPAGYPNTVRAEPVEARARVTPSP